LSKNTFLILKNINEYVIHFSTVMSQTVSHNVRRKCIQTQMTSKSNQFFLVHRNISGKILTKIRSVVFTWNG